MAHSIKIIFETSHKFPEILSLFSLPILLPKIFCSFANVSCFFGAPFGAVVRWDTPVYLKVIL